MSDETVRPIANVRAAMSLPEAPEAHAPREQTAGTPPTGTAVRRRWRRLGYSVGFLSCLLSICVGTVFGLFFWGSETFRSILSQHGFGMVFDGIKGDPLAVWTPERQFPGRSTINVLVLGIDHDYDNKAQIIRNRWGRSDAILLARVDFANKTVSALTIPRDSAVRIPGYRSIHKINAAHSYQGPKLTADTIKSVFGLDTDAIVSIDFEGFQKIVDAIGGVEVNVTKPLHYDDNWGNLHVHLEPGFQHLTGYEAMGYVRIRKVDSDLMRSQRQHEFLEAVRAKLKSPGTFLALPKAFDTLAENINAKNITRDQMYALMNFARTLPKQNIQVQTLPSIEGPRFVTIDAQKSKDVIARMFFPGQDVDVEIDAPNMAERARTTARRPRRARGSAYVRPPGGLTVETAPAAPAGEEPQAPPNDKPSGEPDPSRGDSGASSGTEPDTTRATG